MAELFHHNLTHVLAALLLVSRLGDAGSTLLISPRLKLESNPIARRLGWPFIWASLLVCLLPYLSVEAAVAVLAPSLLVSASNLGKLWQVRTIGENAYLERMLQLARSSRLSAALAPLAAASFFTMLAGATLILLSQRPPNQLAAWFGFGVLLFGLVQLVYGYAGLRRMFRLAREQRQENPAGQGG